MGGGKTTVPMMFSMFRINESLSSPLSSEPLNEASILDIVLSHSSSAASHMGTGSGLQKRKYGVAFPESNATNSISHDPPPLLYSSKKPFPPDQGHCALSMYSPVSLSQNPPTGPGHSRLLDTSAHHMVGLGPSPSHHPPLQHFPMQRLMDASQAARHPDVYGLYGQYSSKHYGTK